jgi:6-phosphogluconolactonase
VRRPGLWSRRIFLQRLGYLSGLGVVDPRAAWSFSQNPKSSQESRATANVAEPSYAYVATWEHGIQVFAGKENGWRLVQTIASDQPSCLALHPSRNFLYAVNEIAEYHGLPTGTVEAYGIDARDGRLTLLNRRPLSLSAVNPRYLAISPDGSTLIVAVHGGGSYNLLPIRADGFLERVSGIFKEVGSGPDRERQSSAHPQMVLFDAAHHRLLSADLGSDRLNVFTLAEDQLVVSHQRTLEPGSGPRCLALHPSGRVLYAANELNSSISCFAYDVANGRILNRVHHQPLHSAASWKGRTSNAMAMHPSGNFLYTSSSRSVATSGPAESRLAVWRICAATGKLDLIHESDKSIDSSSVATMVPTQNALFVLTPTNGIYRLDLDPASGVFGRAVQVAKVAAPKSLVLQYL